MKKVNIMNKLYSLTKLKTLILSGVILFFACGEKIVSFKGGSVSISDIQKAAESDMFKLHKQEYEIKKRFAYEVALQKIIQLEAKKKKVSKQILIESYVEKNFEPPSEKTLKDYYSYKKQSLGKSFQEARQQIYEQVVQYTKKNLENRYRQELAKAYDLKFDLKEPLTPVVSIDTKKEPFFGNPKAKVVIVEYSDLECPYCQRMQSDAQKIREQYKDKIKWVFKDFPLSFHRNARKAHIAINCALQQDKFFEYQSKIFKPNADLSPQNLIASASNIGINIEQFEKCLADPNGELSREIDMDIETGSKSGVSGTPTVFVNGRISNSFRSYEGMKQVIEAELSQMGVN